MKAADVTLRKLRKQNPDTLSHTVEDEGRRGATTTVARRHGFPGVTDGESLLRVQTCCKTTASTNNLFRNSIASGYDLQSLDFLGSCQQQVSLF